MRSGPKTPIGCRHLPHQPDRLGREPWLARARLGCVPSRTYGGAHAALTEASATEQGQVPASRCEPLWPQRPGEADRSCGMPFG